MRTEKAAIFLALTCLPLLLVAWRSLHAEGKHDLLPPPTKETTHVVPDSDEIFEYELMTE